MTREQKTNLLEQFKETVKENQNFILTDYRGLTVEEITNLRTKLYEKNVSYIVVKNTLFRLALKDAKIEGVDEMVVGPVAVAFSKDDPVSPSKILVDFAKETKKKLKIRGGYANGEVLNAKSVDQLSQLPSIEEIYGKIIGCLQSPATGITRALVDGPRKLAQLLNEISKQKESN